VARGDVEKNKLIGAGRIVIGGALDRVAGVAHVLKLDAFYDTAVFNIQSGNDSLRRHVYS
jgi:hypothetical protein